MIPLLFILVVIAVVVAGIVVSWQRKQKRRQDLAAWALQHKLSFAIEDPYGLTGLGFHLFSKGEGRGCENVIGGPWEGLDVRLADYWYYERSSDSRGGTSRTYYRFTVALASVAAWLPAVRVEHENALTRLADHVAMRDIEFESEEFNRRFEVHAGDREFAFKLLDARMMAWLLATAGKHCYEVSGPWVLAYSKQLPAAEAPILLHAVKGFVAQVPRLVWADYGKAGS